MGNSQSYDVTNVSSRDAKRQEKIGSVKPLQDDLPPRIPETNEGEKTENKSPTERVTHHQEQVVEHHKSAAPPPPVEQKDVLVSHEETKNITETDPGESVQELQYLHRVEEPEAIPVEAFPSQSRYD